MIGRLLEIFRIRFRHDNDQGYVAASSNHCSEDNDRYDTQAVRELLNSLGITNQADDVIAFIINSARRSPRDVWKEAEFLCIIDLWGRSDPKDTWYEVFKPCLSVIASLRSLRRASEAGICKVKFRFGNTAAGHCDHSRSMDGKVMLINDAFPLPRMGCSHPSQCGCRWQSHIEFSAD